MKKLLTVLLAFVLVFSLVFAFASCDMLGGDETHTHEFTKKVTDEKYLLYRSTCTTPASYYYSCECGEAGTETFTLGVASGHHYQKKRYMFCMRRLQF